MTGIVSDYEAGIYEIMKFGDVNLNGFQDLLINVKEDDKERLLLL